MTQANFQIKNYGCVVVDGNSKAIAVPVQNLTLTDYLSQLSKRVEIEEK